MDDLPFIFHDTGMHTNMGEGPHASSFGITQHQTEYQSGEHHQGDAHQNRGAGLPDFVLRLLGPAGIHFGEDKGWLNSNADIDLWHLQHHDDTCAIVSQQLVLESLTGHSVSENELMQEAYERGWYNPGGGTPAAHVGDLLQAHGIPIERGGGRSIKDLESQLDQGNKVIVAVNGNDIWYPHTLSIFDTILTDIGFMPGQPANHAVQVVSIDHSNASHPMVVLNDSGIFTGAGERVPLDIFEQAWATSNDFMVSTEKAQTI